MSSHIRRSAARPHEPFDLLPHRVDEPVEQCDQFSIAILINGTGPSASLRRGGDRLDRRHQERSRISRRSPHGCRSQSVEGCPRPYHRLQVERL